MGEVLEDRVINFYADNVHMTFEPKTEEAEEEIEKKLSNKDNIYGKSKIIAIILAIFLGRFGLHKFYLGKPALGLLYLIFSRFQIIMFLCICDVLIYILMDKETWLKKYGYQKRPKKKS